MKIFVIGFNKTGTTSLQRLFTEWGFRSVHAMFSDWDPTDERFQSYECFLDGEGHDFRSLHRQYPASRFILLSRRLDDWLISRIRHTEVRRARGKSGAMRLEYEASPHWTVRAWVARRQSYYQDVLEYFKDKHECLLPLNICDSKCPARTVATLANFLGCNPRLNEHPSMPHVRRGDKAAKVVGGRLRWLLDRDARVRSKEVVRQEVVGVLRELGLDETEWIDDGLQPFYRMRSDTIRESASH